jgi:hypothetical protein
MGTINFTTLNTELLTDPAGLGYAAEIAAGSDGNLATLLNAPKADVSVFRGVIDGREVVSATTPAEFLSLTSAQQTLYLAITGASGGVDTSNALVRSAFAAMFAAGATRTALLAIASREGSRAEELFGTGTTISHLDVARALGRN